MPHSDFTIRTATSQERAAARECFGAALMFEPRPSAARERLFEPDRTLLALRSEQVVGTARTLTRDLSIPGAIVPAAHISAVGVRPEFRRRGVLSALIRRQLSRDEEALAVLWASEPGIYERFGYAPATTQASYKAVLPRVSPIPPRQPGRLRELPSAEAPAALGEVLTQYQRLRPGVSGRERPRWDAALEDPEEQRQGATALRVLVHDSDDGTIDGYALWRGKSGFDNTGPSGEIQVQELVATSDQAYHALWHHLLTMDLAVTLRYGMAAVDEPVRQLVSNHRALDAALSDGLWLRITDVPRALRQRRYHAAVDVTMDITDPVLPANNRRFRLRADADGASCEPTDDSAQLSLSINALSAAYLGARSLADMTVAGDVVAHTPGVLETVATALWWPVAAKSIEVF